jgi:hypothetical protein
VWRPIMRIGKTVKMEPVRGALRKMLGA